MTKLTDAFKDSKIVIPFIVVGDPNEETTIETAVAQADAGAKVIELGVPFSDPVADGAIVKDGNRRALEGGITVAKVFDAIARIRLQTQVPLVLVTYANIPYQFGYDKFAAKAAKFAIDGVIIPDQPHEEAAPIREALENAGVAYIPIVAPASAARMQEVAKGATGFVTLFPAPPAGPALQAEVAALRQTVQAPLVVNADVTQASAAKEIAAEVDGIQLNTAYVQMIADHAAVATLGTYTQNVVAAVQH